MATYQIDVIGKPTDLIPKIGSATIFTTNTGQNNKSTSASENKKQDSYANIYSRLDTRFGTA